MLLAAYGQLVPADLLAIGARQPLNVHPSLLPRHRGAAPVAATILAGDARAGVTLMVMTAELDAGRSSRNGRCRSPVARRRPSSRGGWRSSPPRWCRRVLERWAPGPPAEPRRTRRPRPWCDSSGETTAGSTGAARGWSSTARFAPSSPGPAPGRRWTGAGCTSAARTRTPGVNDVPIGALLPGEPPRVACGQGALVLDVVQPEGRPAMPGDAWRRGVARDHVLLGAAPPD